jgi:AraC family transcriptional regulator
MYSERPVIDIALEAGYETHESFTRAFKERFGRPPRDYRGEASCVEHDFDVEPAIVRVPPRHIAFVRHVGRYDDTGPAFEKVLSWAGDRGLLVDARLVGIYWDDQRITPPDRTRCEVGVFVHGHAGGDDEIEVRPLAGGDHAVLRFHGTAHDRRRGYDLLYGRWLAERGRQPADLPPYEEYAASGGRVVDGFDLITDVHVPLLPKQAA